MMLDAPTKDNVSERLAAGSPALGRGRSTARPRGARRIDCDGSEGVLVSSVGAAGLGGCTEKRTARRIHPLEAVRVEERGQLAQSLGRHAVVIGAGLAGLAAGQALAEAFDRVTVFERDTLPETPVARAGAPQGRHLHSLLASGQRALESLFPGLEAALEAAGAVLMRAGLDLRTERPGFDPFPRRDLGWHGYAMSRPLVEHCVRTFARESVELRAGCRVERIALSADGARVMGVEHTNGSGERETLEAELVVDASGRGALISAALEASGRPLPEETRIEVNLGYSTGLFRIPAGAAVDFKAAVTFPDVPANGRGGLLLGIEGGRWILSVGGQGAEKPPGDWGGFMEFVRQLRTPTIYDAVHGAERLGDIARFGFPASVWRHFERLEQLPVGLLPLGDAICRFNPIYGQGMSVAAQEACLLRRQLEAVAHEPAPLAALGRRFLAEVPGLLDGPWALSALPDLANPSTKGVRPPDLGQRLRFGAALARLAAEDPDVHRLMLEVQHLLRPRSALAEPGLQRRVAELMAG